MIVHPGWLSVLLLCVAPSLPAQAPLATATPAVQSASLVQSGAPSTSPTPQQAAEAVSPAVEPTPEQVGDALIAHQRYQAAIAAYAKAPQNSADVWNKMGIAYQMLFDTKDALRCYKTSLKLDPSSSRVLNNIGTAYDALKQFRQSEHAYRRAIKLDPKFALAYKNLGSDLMAQHNFRKGAEAYRQALALDPHIFEDHSTLRVENPASARDRGAMNYYMAQGCARSGQTDNALHYLRLSINEGYANAKKIAADPVFAPLRGVPEFERMIGAPVPPNPQ
jgi:tetratricopeptide (TPR) repeat protein